MQVNWHRNASEKDNNKPHGTGELLEVLFPAQASESIAIIVDGEGNFVEKPLSLIKQADVQPPVNTLELESSVNTLTSKLEEATKDYTELQGELTIALDEIAKLKKPKVVSKPATKVTPKPVDKSK